MVVNVRRKNLTSRLEVRLSPHLRRWLAAAAAERGVSDADMIRTTMHTMLSSEFPHLRPAATENDEQSIGPLRRLAAQT